MTFFGLSAKLARFGFEMWVKLLGRKRATKLLIGGVIASTIAAVILEHIV